MSKVDQSSWITLSITLTPDDILGIEDAIADLRWHGGASSGILEHIVEQYKLKVEARKEQLQAHEQRHQMMQILFSRKLT